MQKLEECFTVAQQQLFEQFSATRTYSVELVESLSPEDMQIQAVAETSPTKWHLAHTSWFFETFLLKPFVSGYSEFDPIFEVLFNSYYHGVGEQFSRQHRGLITRPNTEQVLQYRRHIDQAISRLIQQCHVSDWSTVQSLITLGINHEQQHQELILTDIKYNLFQNPSFPAFFELGTLTNSASMQLDSKHSDKTLNPPGWTDIEEGFYSVGYSLVSEGGSSEASSSKTSIASFCFDNELPKHEAFIPGARVANRLVTNAEYLAFIEDGGYEDPLYWLDDGWAWKEQQQAKSPLYWLKRNDGWLHYTLYGVQSLCMAAPVKHVNYYEANAYATWAGKRLPTEFEWEAVANSNQLKHQAIEQTKLEPAIALPNSAMQQLFGEVWQWTQSSYHPYPGFRIAEGAVGEYNGKFMCNQYVLKGGSRLTPKGHIRHSYRNFFHPHAAWQYSGIRLAEDLTK
jgi:ergothioneine biosynthesis protein EgtB